MQNCQCGQNFEINHVLTGCQGGFHTIHHNELRETLVLLLKEVCQEVMVEPPLQLLIGERLSHWANKEAYAWLDIRARGFWDNMLEAFLDVRVFCPLAPSYRSQNLPAVYRQHERKKRLEYGQRVREVEPFVVKMPKNGHKREESYEGHLGFKSAVSPLIFPFGKEESKKKT